MFIKFLLIFFLVTMLLRLVLPTLLRWALTAFVKKQMRNGSVAFGPNGAPFGPPPAAAEDAAPRSGGHVRVDYVPPSGKRQPKSDFNGGDYVDFEEVK